VINIYNWRWIKEREPGIEVIVRVFEMYIKKYPVDVTIIK
jgi:hypothetical protein